MKKIRLTVIVCMALLFGLPEAFAVTRTITIVDMPQSKYTLKVYKLSGEKLVDVSGRAFQGKRLDQPILQKDRNGNLYISFLNRIRNRAEITVMRFKGARWIRLGKPIAASPSGPYDFKVDHLNRPAVLFEDEAFSNKLTALYFDGASWQPLGKRGFTRQRTAKAMKLAFDADNRAHVLAGTLDFPNNRYKMSILTFNGTEWSQDPDFGITEKLTHSPIIDDFTVQPPGRRYVAWGFQSGSDRPGLKVCLYRDGKTTTLTDNRQYNNYFFPSMAIDAKQRVFILCTSFHGAKKTRILNLLELKDSKPRRLGLENDASLAYARRSNLAADGAGNLGFLFSRYESNRKISATFVCSQKGKLHREGPFIFANFTGIADLALVFDHANTPFIALLLFT